MFCESSRFTRCDPRAQDFPLFALIIGNFLTPPVVHAIDAAGYHGRIGDAIKVLASDVVGSFWDVPRPLSTKRGVTSLLCFPVSLFRLSIFLSRSPSTARRLSFTVSRLPLPAPFPPVPGQLLSLRSSRLALCLSRSQMRLVFGHQALDRQLYATCIDCD